MCSFIIIKFNLKFIFIKKSDLRPLPSPPLQNFRHSVLFLSPIISPLILTTSQSPPLSLSLTSFSLSLSAAGTRRRARRPRRPVEAAAGRWFSGRRRDGRSGGGSSEARRRWGGSAAPDPRPTPSGASRPECRRPSLSPPGVLLPVGVYCPLPPPDLIARRLRPPDPATSTADLLPRDEGCWGQRSSRRPGGREREGGSSAVFLSLASAPSSSGRDQRR